MLKIKDMNLNNVIRQGDSQPREYQLDTGNLDLNLTNKSAIIRLMTADFQGIGYETTATVSSDNKISFSIDDVIPAREYRLEVTVDDYVFPSRATDGQFSIDPSSHGQEANIIQIIGKDEIVRDVKARVENELEPFLGEIEQAEAQRQSTFETNEQNREGTFTQAEATRQQAELDRQAQEEARGTAEGERDTAEVQRKADHANRGAEFDGKADKVVLKNLVENGNFSDGLTGWAAQTILTDGTKVVDGKLHVYGENSGSLTHPSVLHPTYTIVGHKNYFRIEVSEMASNSVKFNLQDRNDPFLPKLSDGIHSRVTTIKSGQHLTSLYLNHTMPTGSVVDYKVDSLISIDLTEAFGPGNEPTKEEMDELIKFTGYIDGEYALNNEEMFIWTLALIRRNKNAIIALGGAF